MDNAESNREVMWAWGAVLAGLLIAALTWHGKHWTNFAYTWLPQAASLLAMFLLGARPAAVTGAALAFAGFLKFYAWLVVTYYARDGFAWLVYLFCLPGGFVGSILATKWLNKRDEWSATATGLTAAAFVIAGIIINYGCVVASI